MRLEEKMQNLYGIAKQLCTPEIHFPPSSTKRQHQQAPPCPTSRCVCQSEHHQMVEGRQQQGWDILSFPAGHVGWLCPSTEGRSSCPVVPLNSGALVPSPGAFGPSSGNGLLHPIHFPSPFRSHPIIKCCSNYPV